MDVFRADLHIHTVLSPCGDLEMSPKNIVMNAKKQGLDIIGITDHNSTKHGPLIKKIGEQNGIFVMLGVEVTTKEEVHCLAYFEDEHLLADFQQYLSDNLPYIKNNPDYFGYQVVLDEKENIIEEVDSLLVTGINQSIDEVEHKVRTLKGVFIPAHVDRPRNSIISQLGFMPDNLRPDAIEINGVTEKKDFLIKYPEFKKFTLIKNSDSHTLLQIGCRFSSLRLEGLSFSEIVLALHNEQGRAIV